MSNVIDFPTSIKTCGDCKIFEECYTESIKIFGEESPEEKQESKNILVCKDAKL